MLIAGEEGSGRGRDCQLYELCQRNRRDREGEGGKGLATTACPCTRVDPVFIERRQSAVCARPPAVYERHADVHLYPIRPTP